MARTVNLLYYQRHEMAESPKRRAEFGILTKRCNLSTCALAFWQIAIMQSSEMFWRPKREAEFGNGKATCLLSLSRSPFSLYSSSLSLNMVLVQAIRILSIFYAKPNANPDQIGIQTQYLLLLYTTEQTESARLFLLFWIGTPHLVTRRWVCPPPLV